MFSESQLYRLRHQHQTLRELTKGLTQEQLGTAVNAGKWSAQQNIAHLAAYQPAFITRLKRIAEEQEPLFDRYVADNDPAFAEACRNTVPDLLLQIEDDRNRIVQLLLQMDEKALERTAIHARYGKLDITRWVEFFLLHEAHHLFTIFMLTADLRNMQAKEISTFTK